MTSKTNSSSSESYASGIENLDRQIYQTIIEALKPEPDISLSEWADRFAYLSPENSSAPGKFKCYGFQRGMLDAVTDPSVKKVTFMKSARVGYTSLVCHSIGYYIHQDPSPMLVVQPKIATAKKFSRKYIAPMLRDTPVLSDLTGPLSAANREQTLEERQWRNGASVSFVGSNSPDGLSGGTYRVVCFDEVDRYAAEGAGEDGDQIEMGERRTETFWNNKIILGSTPVTKGASRIEQSFLEGDQRHYYLACPHCEHKQVLDFKNMEWHKDKNDKGETIKHYPETAFFWCQGCGAAIEEHHKRKMVEKGEWIAHAPFEGHASFHIWSAYSPNANASWGSIAAKWLQVHNDPGRKKTFYNLTLGQSWEEQGEKLTGSELYARREEYTPDTLPDAVRVLTCGIDVQNDRIEAEIIAWGAQEEAWVVRTYRLPGDPTQPEVWDDLETVLKTKCQTFSGRQLSLRMSCIDSGHHSERVYAFVKRRGKALRLLSVKSLSTPGKRPWPSQSSRGGLSKNEVLYPIGADTIKFALHRRLKLKVPGPEYIHFPDIDSIDEEYFEQLTAEKLMPKKVGGLTVKYWKNVRANERNEAWDMFVYAFAALKSLAAVDLDRVKQPPPSAHIDTFEASSTVPSLVELEQPPDKQPVRQQLKPAHLKPVPFQGRPRKSYWDK